MPNKDEASASDVAVWMMSELDREGLIYQDTIVYDIERKFGERFTYTNAGGNQAISKDVLTAFRKISETSVVWDRLDRAWRKRECADEPGRQQV